MAEKSGTHKPADELNNEIARTREQLARNLGNVRDDLNIPRRVRRSFRSQPVLWIGGAIALGAILTLLPKRGKRSNFPVMASASAQNKFVAMSLALAALRVVANMCKPMITSFVESKLGGYGNGPREKSGHNRWARRF